MEGSRWCTLVAILLLMVAALAQSKDAIVSEVSNEEVYQIDYRGPETHSALPPPELSWADPKPKPRMKPDLHKARKIKHG